jgi:hypothetical protein
MLGPLLWLLAFCGSLFWALHRPAVVLRIAGWGIAGLCCLFGLEVVSGLAYGGVAVAEMHRWGAHGTVIWASLTFAIVLAATLERAIRLRRWRPLSDALVAVVALLLWLYTSFTGYLGPSRARKPLDPDTLLRFRVIHMVFLPTLLAALLAWWWLRFRKNQRTFPASMPS